MKEKAGYKIVNNSSANNYRKLRILKKISDKDQNQIKK